MQLYSAVVESDQEVLNTTKPNTEDFLLPEDLITDDCNVQKFWILDQVCTNLMQVTCMTFCNFFCWIEDLSVCLTIPGLC